REKEFHTVIAGPNMHPNSQNTKSLMRGVAAPFTENGSEQSFCTALLFHFSRTLLAAADHSLQRECSNSPIVGNLKFTRNFPSEERFGLTNQMRRAAVPSLQTLPRAARARLTLIMRASWRSPLAVCLKSFPKPLLD